MTRLLNELPPNVVTHATFFLTLRGLGALDVTCQRFHPVGLIQKACMLRAKMHLPRARWAAVARPALSWPRWLDEVRFRGVLRRSACDGFLRTGMDQRRAAAGSLRCRARSLVEDSRTTNSGVENRLVG